MFIHRLSIDRNLLAKLRRSVSAQVGRLVMKPVAAPQAVAVPACENGVCVIAWKPERPAA